MSIVESWTRPRSTKAEDRPGRMLEEMALDLKLEVCKFLQLGWEASSS